MLNKIALCVFALFVVVTGIGLYLSTTFPPIDTQPAASTTTQKPQPKTFPLSEIQKHNSLSSCWLLINKKVYDVTGYEKNHPGGVQNISENCGKNVTSIFTQIHSNRAWDLLGKFYIGIAAS